MISRDGSDESSHAVGVMAFASDCMRFQTVSARGLGPQSKKSGADFAGRLARGAGGELLLVFPDGLTLHSAGLFAGIEAGLQRPLAMVGGAAGEMMQFQRTYQYHDGAVLSDAVAGVLIEGDFETEIEVNHGCDVVGIERTVTRAEGSVVYEIDDRPAWSVVQEYLEERLRRSRRARRVLCVRRRAHADDERRLRAVRHPHAASARQGHRCAHLPRRAAHRRQDLHGAPRSHAHPRQRHPLGRANRRAPPGQSPLAVLQFDCTGRGRLLFGERTTADLIAPMQAALDPKAPWLGFHTYGEIAPVAGRTHYHNYTVVLCAIYETRPLSTAEELQAQNLALSAQLRQLVKTESRLYRTQRQLDDQLKRIGALNQFALDASRAIDPVAILEQAAGALMGIFPFEQALGLLGDRAGGGTTLRAVVARSVLGREAHGSPMPAAVTLPDGARDALAQPMLFSDEPSAAVRPRSRPSSPRATPCSRRRSRVASPTSSCRCGGAPTRSSRCWWRAASRRRRRSTSRCRAPPSCRSCSCSRITPRAPSTTRS